MSSPSCDLVNILYRFAQNVVLEMWRGNLPEALARQYMRITRLYYSILCLNTFL